VGVGEAGGPLGVGVALGIAVGVAPPGVGEVPGLVLGAGLEVGGSGGVGQLAKPALNGVALATGVGTGVCPALIDG
jgi:hypothetical protein